MAAARGRSYNPCQICPCKINDSKKLRNVGTSESASAALDRLCSEVGQPRMQLIPDPVSARCFQDLEKLSKARSTVEVLWGQFLCHLRCRTATLQQSTVSELTTQWKSATKYIVWGPDISTAQTFGSKHLILIQYEHLQRAYDNNHRLLCCSAAQIVKHKWQTIVAEGLSAAHWREKRRRLSLLQLPHCFQLGSQVW